MAETKRKVKTPCSTCSFHKKGCCPVCYATSAQSECVNYTNKEMRYAYNRK